MIAVELLVVEVFVFAVRTVISDEIRMALSLLKVPREPDCIYEKYTKNRRYVKNRAKRYEDIRKLRLAGTFPVAIEFNILLHLRTRHRKYQARHDHKYHFPR